MPAASGAYSAHERSSFLTTQIANGKIPELALLRILDGVLAFLGNIHTLETASASINYSGILWNDVKAEHVFYDPQSASITLIDWGNSHFLEADGATADRQHSRLDDYQQYLDEMGRFVKETAPDLYTALSWPENIAPSFAYSEGVAP